MFDVMHMSICLSVRKDGKKEFERRRGQGRDY